MHKAISLLAGLGLAAASVTAGGCRSFGDGTGDVRGELRVQRCRINGAGVYSDVTLPSYDLRPSFYVAERHGDVLQFRVQRDSRLLVLTDTLLVDVRDVSQVQVGVPIEVRPDLAPDTGPAALVRVALSPRDTCPRFVSSLAGRGSITFNEFDPRTGGVADATFTIDLVDTQAPRVGGSELVVGALRGRFRMPLQLEPEPG